MSAVAELAPPTVFSPELVALAQELRARTAAELAAGHKPGDGTLDHDVAAANLTLSALTSTGELPVVPADEATQAAWDTYAEQEVTDGQLTGRLALRELVFGRAFTRLEGVLSWTREATHRQRELAAQREVPAFLTALGELAAR